MMTNISRSAGQFAGIEMTEFHWARQRAKRALVFWVVAVLTLAGWSPLPAGRSATTSAR